MPGINSGGNFRNLSEIQYILMNSTVCFPENLHMPWRWLLFSWTRLGNMIVMGCSQCFASSERSTKNASASSSSNLHQIAPFCNCLYMSIYADKVNITEIRSPEGTSIGPAGYLLWQPYKFPQLPSTISALP